MKTYPYLRADGSVRAFEIPIPFIHLGILRFLRSIEGVSEAKEPWEFAGELRFVFKFRGVPCVVREDFGDSGRYWVGPQNATASDLDLAPVHQAFQAYRDSALWRWVSHLDTYDYLGPWTPSTAFAVAVAGCAGYFSLPDAFFRMVSPPVPAIFLLVVPAACSGLFHYMVVRDSGLPRLRQWVQVAGTTSFAPVLGGLLAATWSSP
jgi:hypothetical protein